MYFATKQLNYLRVKHVAIYFPKAFSEQVKEQRKSI